MSAPDVKQRMIDGMRAAGRRARIAVLLRDLHNMLAEAPDNPALDKILEILKEMNE